MRSKLCPKLATHVKTRYLGRIHKIEPAEVLLTTMGNAPVFSFSTLAMAKQIPLATLEPVLSLSRIVNH